MSLTETSGTLSRRLVPRFGREFFDVECTKLAKNLLGQVLVRREEDCILSGRIVETEAYPGGDDLASNTHHGKRSERTAPAFMAPGTMYVYKTYGMYYIFNISSQGDGAAVLLRALEPVYGAGNMKIKRSFFGKKKKEIKDFKLDELCNGPAKLSIALSIDSTFSGNDLVTSSEIWIEQGPEPISEDQIIECPRIGIDSAGPLWASMPFRYYIKGNNCVSKPDIKVEKQLLERMNNPSSS